MNDSVSNKKNVGNEDSGWDHSHLPKIDSGYAGYIGIGGVNVALDSSVKDFNVYFLFTLSIP